MTSTERISAYPHGSHAAPNPRGRLRRRMIDWALGALGMLVLVLLALVLFWLSITQPLDDGGAASPVSPSPSASTPPPAAQTTPPAGLADDEVWLGDISLNATSVFAAGTPLNNVVATGIDVTSGPQGLVARHLDLTATVPFAVVAAELGPDATLSAADRGEARLVTKVEVLGRNLPVGATGTVDVVAGELVIVPTSIDLGVPAFLEELLVEAVRELITIEHEIEGLPDGVVLRSVEVVDSGVRANLTGDNVRLVQ